ncbi:MAG: hypothetical protein QXQ57_04760 [Sulfolobales archaeon]
MPLKEMIYGNARIQIYGGWREIGGNCIAIIDGDRKLVFDNGIRFQILRQLYGGRVEPLGPVEMQSLNIIPGAEVFRDAEALYISHAHLDHLGLLSIIPKDVEIIIPSRSILEDTVFNWYRGSRTWLAYVLPDIHSRISEASIFKQDGHNVIAIPVSHSAYPAYAFIYMGKNVTIFYSGDLRLEPLTNRPETDLQESLQRLGIDGVDIAIIEGTNFSDELEHYPLTPHMFRSILLDALSHYDLVAVSIDPLDLEMFQALIEYSRIGGRRVVIASDRILWMPEYLYREGRIDLSSIALAYIDMETLPTSLPIEYISLAEEVLKEKSSYIVIFEPITMLETLRKLRLWKEDLFLHDSIAYITNPEPREAMREVEERIIAKWLRILGFQVYRLRLSGHYYPHQFTDLIKTLKPKNIIPIHTENPEYMNRIYEKLRKNNHPH